MNQSLANASVGKGLGTKLVRALVELLFQLIPVTKIKRTRRRATCERSDATRKRGLRQGMYPRWSSLVHGSNTPGIRRTQCCLTLPSRGDVRPWPPLMSSVKHHREAVIAEVSTQLSEVVGVIERHRTGVAGRTFVRLRGLKPHSDIDLLVTVTVRLDRNNAASFDQRPFGNFGFPWKAQALRAVRSHH